MNNFTLQQKQQLETLVESGKVATTIAYDPTITAAPPQPANTTVFYTESSANLVETIYVTN